MTDDKKKPDEKDCVLGKDGKMRCKGEDMGKVQKMKCDVSPKTGKEQCIVLVEKDQK